MGPDELHACVAPFTGMSMRRERSKEDGATGSRVRSSASSLHTGRCRATRWQGRSALHWSGTSQTTACGMTSSPSAAPPTPCRSSHTRLYDTTKTGKKLNNVTQLTMTAVYPTALTSSS